MIVGLPHTVNSRHTQGKYSDAQAKIDDFNCFLDLGDHNVKFFVVLDSLGNNVIFDYIWS